MTKLSDTALTILNAAAQRDDRLAELPAKLPSAARDAVARSLLKQGLLEKGQGEALRITDAGLRALNLGPPQSETMPTAPQSGAQESMGAEAGTSPAAATPPRAGHTRPLWPCHARRSARPRKWWWWHGRTATPNPTIWPRRSINCAPW